MKIFDTHIWIWLVARNLQLNKHVERSIPFAILILFLFFGFIQTFSQQKFPPNDSITVLAVILMYSPTSSEKATYKIITIAGKSLDDYAKTGESPPLKGVTVDHCDNCPLANFGFGIISNKIIDKNTVKVGIEIEFESKKSCNSKKKFFLIREKKTDIKLKCGVKLIAFYGSDFENIENNEQSSNNN